MNRRRTRAVLSRRDFVEYAIQTAEAFAAVVSEISVRTKILPKLLAEILDDLHAQGRIIDLGLKLFIHRDRLGQLRRKLLDIVDDYHQKQPESPGLTLEQLYETSGLRKGVFDGLLRLLLAEKKLIEKKSRLALPEHRESFSDDEQQLIDRIETLFIERAFNPPNRQEIIDHTKTAPEKVQKVMKILIEQQRLVRIDKDL